MSRSNVMTSSPSHRSGLRPWLLTALLVASAGCAESGEAPVPKAAPASDVAPAGLPDAAAGPSLEATNADAEVAPTVLVAAQTLDAVRTQTWREWATERAAEAGVAEFGAKVDALEPRRARDGSARFSAPWLDDPNAVPHLALRLLEANDLSEREALALALARSTTTPTDLLADLAVGAQDPSVRAIVTSTLWRRSEAAGRDALRTAIADDAEAVRVAAIVAASRHAEGAALREELLRALSDDAADVRRVAARGIGVVGTPADAPALEALAANEAVPEVRKTALRGLAQLDLPRARALVSRKNLTDDDVDPTVARVARGIVAR